MAEIPWHRCPLFAALPERHLLDIGRLISVREVPKDAFLFHETEPCTGFFVLLDGAVRLSRFGPADGRETPLHQVTAGQSFAEAAMFGGMPFPATAIATRASKVAFVPGGPFLALLRDHPEISLALLASQARWLQRLVTRLTQLGSQDAESRLREWLRDTSGAARMVRIQGTKKELAAQLGMSPETFSRTLAALRRKGLVEVRGPVIRIEGRL